MGDDEELAIERAQKLIDRWRLDACGSGNFETDDENTGLIKYKLSHDCD